MPDYISVSQINTYLLCPRKYRYRYIDRLVPEHRSIALALGTAVHSAIAWWSEERLAGADPTLEVAQRTFRADLHAQAAAGDFDLEGKSLEEVEAQGQALVKLFVEQCADLALTLVEHRVEVPLFDPRTGERLPVPLVGFVDFLAEGCVGEIKTSARRSSAATWLLQLSAYVYAIQAAGLGKRKALVVQLVKTKTPKLVKEELEVTGADELWFLEVAAEVFDSIQAGAFFPNPGWACPRCEYRSTCRAGLVQQAA